MRTEAGRHLAQTLVAPGCFETREHPDAAPAPGMVRVRVEAVALCGSDLAAFRGLHPRIVPPVVLGHELSGLVESVGASGQRRLLGRRVAVDPLVACHSCLMCRRGKENLCRRYQVLGESGRHPGGLAGSVVVASDRVHALPDDVPWESGALLQALAVAFHAVHHRARVSPGESVFVVGCGPIGLSVVSLCAALGARVAATDPRPERLILAKAFGADETWMADPERTSESATSWTTGEGFDICFDAAGGTTTEPFHTAFDAAGPDGRIVVLGTYAQDAVTVALNQIKQHEKQVMGSQAHPHSFASSLTALARSHRELSRMISHRFAWSQAADAFEVLDSSAGATKVMIMRDIDA